ncbi:MAG: DUF4147 domain-containing protein [archaeon]
MEDAKKLFLDSLRIPPHKTVYIIGWGKSVDEFCELAFSKISSTNNVRCLYISLKKYFKYKNIERLESSHPLVSRKSIVAGEKIIAFLRRLKKEDILIIFSGGGGSSMFELFDDRVSLTDAKHCMKLMLSKDANSRLINYVRRKCSLVKDGGLLSYIRNNNVHTYILSDDVLTDSKVDACMYVASGPTCAAQYSERELNEFHSQIHSLGIDCIIDKNLLMQRKSGEKIQRKIEHKIICSNTNLILNIRKELEANDFNLILRKKPFYGNTKKVAKELIREFSNLCKTSTKPLAYVCGGESTVHVTGKGKGGRLQDLIARMIYPISKIKNAHAVGFASDGQDYLPKIRGAYANSNTFQQTNNLYISKFINNNDTYTLHKSLGNIIYANETNLNVGDIVIMLSI